MVCTLPVSVRILSNSSSFLWFRGLVWFFPLPCSNRNNPEKNITLPVDFISRTVNLFATSRNWNCQVRNTFAAIHGADEDDDAAKEDDGGENRRKEGRRPWSRPPNCGGRAGVARPLVWTLFFFLPLFWAEQLWIMGRVSWHNLSSLSLKL